jgi:hypothetical protein|nr:MAG TPA: hypothetical protein [Caudoviricetes sp.]
MNDFYAARSAFYKLKSRIREVALAGEGYLPFDVLSALREQDLESFRVNLWRQYEVCDSWTTIDAFWDAVDSDGCFEAARSAFKPAALVATFRPFTSWDIQLIKLANRNTKSNIIRYTVNSLIFSLEENLPLNLEALFRYKREVSEILIDAAGDGNAILTEELYGYVLACVPAAAKSPSVREIYKK